MNWGSASAQKCRYAFRPGHVMDATPVHRLPLHPGALEEPGAVPFHRLGLRAHAWTRTHWTKIVSG
jgi:hypothetical protein